MTTYTFDEAIVSDLHKDARGFRPGQLWWEAWIFAGPDRKQAIWDNLCEELNQSIEREAREQSEAYSRLMARLADTIRLGAKNITQALVWVMQAEDFSEVDLRYGPDYFAYHFGIAYEAAREWLPVKQAMAELEARS